jgi:hypothetical protein
MSGARHFPSAWHLSATTDEPREEIVSHGARLFQQFWDIPVAGLVSFKTVGQFSSIAGGFSRSFTSANLPKEPVEGLDSGVC